MDEKFISTKKKSIEYIYNIMNDDSIDEQIINKIDVESLNDKELVFLTRIILILKPNKLIEALLDIISRHVIL